MAVTDLTDDLPWWTRQGAGPTGGPAATPQGAGGQPGAGDSTSWLNYLSQMFGVSPAQAATMMQNPANMPSANASNMAFAGHVPATNPDGSFNPPPGNPPITNFGNPAPTSGPGPGNVGPVNLSSQPPVAANVAQPQPAPAGPGGGYGALGPQGWGVTGPSGGYNAGVKRTDAAYGPYNAPVNPDVPAAAAQPVSATRPVPGPLATGGATAQGATSNPRFVPVDRPNMSAAGGFGRGGAPQMTALNLAGLFGGGQPAAAAPAAAPSLIGRSPGMRIINGPLAAPPGRTQMDPTALASAVSKPNWWQNLGRPDMNPDQLARAVKQRNWWQNA